MFRDYPETAYRNFNCIGDKNYGLESYQAIKAALVNPVKSLRSE